MLFDMQNGSTDRQHSRLNRGSLRDAVIVVVLIAALNWDIVGATMHDSFLILNFRGFFHVLTKSAGIGSLDFSRCPCSRGREQR
jgi:hypothetical protein